MLRVKFKWFIKLSDFDGRFSLRVNSGQLLHKSQLKG